MKMEIEVEIMMGNKVCKSQEKCEMERKIVGPRIYLNYQKNHHFPYISFFLFNSICNQTDSKGLLGWRENGRGKKWEERKWRGKKSGEKMLLPQFLNIRSLWGSG